MTEPTWFLLYDDGTSPDGRGEATFVARTTNASLARAHHGKVSRDPYSTGYVLMVTDTGAHRVLHAEEIDADAWERAY